MLFFEQLQYTLDPEAVRSSLCLALDDVQDPGNLGTIIRLADWFGIEHIICSQNTVDVYNPKTIQATMGGIARVKVHYTSLPDFIRSLEDTPVFGTFLDGKRNSGYESSWVLWDSCVLWDAAVISVLPYIPGLVRCG